MNVSIIIAAYNVEKYISRCLDSLLKQTYKNLEIIIVNDCSTDNTLKICEEFEKVDSRITIINKEVNEGLSEARNSGMSIAMGDYITFVDGDDFLANDTIEKCVLCIENNHVDVVVFGSCFDRKDGISYKMDINASSDIFIGKDAMQHYYREALGSLPNEKSDRAIGITPWGRVYKREILEANNLRFISERTLIYEDLMFFLLTAPFIRSTAIINAPLYHYCENEGSLTQRCDLERFFKVKKMYYYIKEHYHSEIFEDSEALLRFKRLMISYIRLSIMQLGKSSSEVGLIKDICKDEFTREIVENYPYHSLPIRQRVFFGLIKYKKSRLLQMLCSYYKG